MLGKREISMEDITWILRKRWIYILVPVLIAPVIGLGISFLLTPKYTSQTLVMIEQQRVPDSVVKSVVSQNLIARISTMQEQVLSRTRLQAIIDKFGLYKDQKNVATDDVLIQMRQNISVVPVTSILSALSASKATISPKDEIPGFSVSFTADKPKIAQEVCAEITGNFVTEDLKTRSQMTGDTTSFLGSRVEDAKRNLDDLEAKLAQLERKYMGELPDDEKNNLSLLTSVNTQLDAATQALARAQQDKTYTESMLAQQLSAWDASKVRPVDSFDHAETIDKEIGRLEDALAIMQARYTADHPDVIKLKAQIEQLKKSHETAPTPKGMPAEIVQAAASAEPREIQQLRSQLHGYESAIVANKREQDRLTQQAKTYQARMQNSPIAQQEYLAVTRDHKTALDFYNELLARKNTSGMASALESASQGEHFSILDQANLPDAPSFPVRWMFAAGGAGGGLSLGLLLILIFEFRDKAMRTERDVEFFLELPTLVLLPSVGVIQKQKNGRWKIWGPKRKKEAEQAIGA